MIHPKSSYMHEDRRHFYGPGRPVFGVPTIRVGGQEDLTRLVEWGVVFFGGSRSMAGK